MKIFFTVLVLFIMVPCSAETILTGGIKYDSQSAREELLQTPVKKTEQVLVAQNLYDKNFKENTKYVLQGRAELKDRTLAFFSDGTYAVLYNNDKSNVWYYAKNGKLIYTEKRDGINYPYKSYKYALSGRLVNMGLRVSEDETFIYDTNGTLIAHWLGQYAYSENGRVIMKRKIVTY